MARDLGLHADWAVVPRRIAVSQGRQLGQCHPGLRRRLAQAAERGHDLYFLDLGGGYPAGHYHTALDPDD